MQILITLGATREFFDPVRFISNPSSGKMGFAVAKAARERGWNVEIISANCVVPEELKADKNVKIFEVVTGTEMFEMAKSRFEFCEIFVAVAAVCDFRPKRCEAHKLKKSGENLVVEFEPTTDILKTLSGTKNARQTTVGFAAETENLESYAKKKLREKNLDLIAANKVGFEQESAFGNDENSILLLGNDDFRLSFPRESKEKIAR